MIQIKNVTRRFGRITALNSVSFSVEKGETLGILGPNGSGKSTLINILLGILRPNEGEATFENLPIWPNREQILPRFGAVIEIPRLYPKLSGSKNLHIFASYVGIENAGRRIDELLQLVKLAEAGEMKFQNYSLGMKQRLGIALCLLNDPEVLIFDEPTNGLDPEGIVQVREVILHLAGLGKTVLLCSHLIHEVEMVCDKVVILKNGNLVKTMNASELQNRETSYEIETFDNSSYEKLLGLTQKNNDLKILSKNEKKNQLVITLSKEPDYQVLSDFVKGGVKISSFQKKSVSLETIFMESLQ